MVVAEPSNKSAALLRIEAALPVCSQRVRVEVDQLQAELRDALQSIVVLEEHVWGGVGERYCESVFLIWRFRQIWRVLGNSVGDKGEIAWHFSPNSVAKWNSGVRHFRQIRSQKQTCRYCVSPNGQLQIMRRAGPRWRVACYCYLLQPDQRL